MIKEDKDRLFKLLDLFSTIKDSGDCLLSNYRKIMKDDTLLPNYEKVLESDYINTKNNIVNSIVNTICNSIVLNDELLKGGVISKHLTENILSIDKNDLLNKSKALVELLSDDVKTDLLLHYESNVELLSKIPRLLNTGNYVSNIIDNNLLNSITLFNSKLDFINKCLTNMAESNILCNENTPVVITSDTHFGQKRTFELSKRDRAFSSVENMDTVMIKYFKDELIMNPNAIFIHLGDRGGDPLNPNHIHETMRSFNILADKSYLILGNYEVCEMKNLNMSFDEYREYLIIKEGWTNVFKHIAFITSPYKIENGLNPRYCLIHDPLDFCCMKKYSSPWTWCGTIPP
jgi:calcineurin-like phosphoesterase family protein